MGLHNRFPIAQWIIDRLHEENHDGFEMHYQTKKDDGLLHPSTHLGCEIEMCHYFDPDIPMKEKDTATLQTFLTGTLWHAWLQGQWESGEWDGIEARCEQKMGEGLPKGWQGSCDLLLGQFGDGKLSEAEWTVFDYKTIKGTNVPYIDLNNPKRQQHMQISAYWHAAKAMGYRMMPEVCIVHIPVSAQPYKQILPPIEQWLDPLPQNEVFGEMKRRSQILKAYLANKEDNPGATYEGGYSNMPQQMPKEQVVNKKGEIIEQQPWIVSYCNSTHCQCKVEKRVIGYHDNGSEVL